MTRLTAALAAVLIAAPLAATAAAQELSVQIGPRPFFLVNDMDAGELKADLQACKDQSFAPTDFSIGHRGAALQFPEHTEQSYRAGARQGAGILECDVTFTQDRELVCRHAQCDLHQTTNILETDLASTCAQGFQPADPENGTKASAKCCTSDITLAQFKSLEPKMDGVNPNAQTVQGYLAGTPDWRTDLYAEGATLMTHAESIALFKELGVKMTPELKAPDVEMPFQGEFSQGDYAAKMIQEYRDAGVDPAQVFPQSFDLSDIEYWVANDPEFAKQAVYLDDSYTIDGFDPRDPGTYPHSMQELADKGVNIIAPPLWFLVTLNEAGEIVPSAYAQQAKAAGLDIITWTLERSGHLKDGGGWYYQTVSKAIDNDGDMLELLDVLAQDVGVRGVFSDWPGTVTYYANCKGL
ncbi:MAG: glycerophosphodiester phosphodiesterase family protein [Rhodovibrio sp.]|nr:glycerophosphodiester phosphodiesterase family protein [Rhodovibrio sp.]